MISDDILHKARAYAVAEIEKYGFPLLLHFDLSEKMARKIQQKLGGDLDIILLGVYLMDLKLGQAVAEKRLTEHIQMSADAARVFLVEEGVDQDIIEKVVHCIMTHHGEIPYESLEEEICANADCYRFASVLGFWMYLHGIGKRGMGFSDALTQAENKLEEKYRILSLDICKEELEPQHRELKNRIALIINY